MKKKENRPNKAQIQEPYKTGYEKAAKGKWYIEEYFVISHLEKRIAEPQIRRRSFKRYEAQPV